ncbi:hypothetical protein PVAG01_10648 [Phlyctema vagabunda]|uniref:Uncharacterized protein n=1 Tax=Phlyctema vagabunda TaxID=108571 RepID=A0ABR4P2V8_9HELO
MPSILELLLLPLPKREEADEPHTPSYAESLRNRPNSNYTVECELPKETTHFVTAPDARGTLEIMQNGLLCILVCIWTVQHLNVPSQREGQDRGYSGKIYWQLKILRTRFKWMLVTLVVPEFLVGKALSDFMGARASMCRVREMKDQYGKPLPQDEIEGWTKVHAFYADMGGFVLRTRNERDDGHTFSLRHLVSEEVLHLRESGKLDKLPDIHKDMINALSKGDVFVKILAIFEILWLAVEVMFRIGYDLPISQLEITACAFCSTTIVTYILWWTKPQGVRIATIIPLETHVTANLNFEPRLPGFWRYRLSALDSSKLRERDRPDEPVWNDSVPTQAIHSHKNLPLGNMATLDIGIILGSILLGSVHLTAWNFQFPSRVEQLGWRYASVAIIATIPTYFLTSAAITTFEKLFLKTSWGEKFFVIKGEFKIKFGLLGFVTAFIYMSARLFILFETVYSIFYLPPRAYITTWSQVFPGIF